MNRSQMTAELERLLTEAGATIVTCSNTMKTAKPTKSIPAKSREDMEAIAANIADIYPGKKLIVLMPGDPVPDDLLPERLRKKRKGQLKLKDDE